MVGLRPLRDPGKSKFSKYGQKAEAKLFKGVEVEIEKSEFHES